MDISLQPEFKIRSAFEAAADALHDAFLLKRGVTQEMQVQMHLKHVQQAMMEKKRRPVIKLEVEDLTHMLR